MLWYLGHQPLLCLCLTACCVLCVTVCIFCLFSVHLLSVHIGLRVANQLKRNWHLGVATETSIMMLWVCCEYACMCVTEMPDNLLLSVCWHGASSTVLELLLSTSSTMSRQCRDAEHHTLWLYLAAWQTHTHKRAHKHTHRKESKREMCAHMSVCLRQESDEGSQPFAFRKKKVF